MAIAGSLTRRRCLWLALGDATPRGQEPKGERGLKTLIARTECDRCGKINDTPADPRIPSQPLPEGWQPIDRFPDSDTRERMDLCSDCSRSLAQWVQAPPKNTASVALVEDNWDPRRSSDGL